MRNRDLQDFLEHLPRGGLVALAEYVTHVRGDYSAGLNWTAARLGEALVAWCKDWKVSPSGCADDSIFTRIGSSAGSIADELNRAGMRLYPARKGSRVAGWERMRRRCLMRGSPTSRACT